MFNWILALQYCLNLWKILWFENSIQLLVNKLWLSNFKNKISLYFKVSLETVVLFQQILYFYIPCSKNFLKQPLALALAFHKKPHFYFHSKSTKPSNRYSKFRIHRSNTLNPLTKKIRKKLIWLFIYTCLFHLLWTVSSICALDSKVFQLFLFSTFYICSTKYVQYVHCWFVPLPINNCKELLYCAFVGWIDSPLVKKSDQMGCSYKKKQIKSKIVSKIFFFDWSL